MFRTRPEAGFHQSGLARLIAVGLLALLLSGCSLLSVKVGSDPMPPRDLKLRLQTREFAAAFSTQVVGTADTIGARSNDPLVRANAIRWKLGATAAVQQSALRTDAMLALVDTWVLARQMKDFFAGRDGEPAALGPDTPLAAQTAAQLEREIATVAGTLLTAQELKGVSSFVEDHCAKYRLKNFAFEREPVALSWLKQESPSAAKSTGSMAEAITDLSDRVGTVSQQIPLEVRWRIDLERQEFDLTSADFKRFSAGADSALQSFAKLAENATLATKAANDLAVTLAPEFERFDQRWVATLATLKTEREAVLAAVQIERAAVVASLVAQRESLVRDFARERAEITAAAEQMTQRAIAQAGQEARAFVRTVLLFGSLLAFIVLGLPFFAGYWVGRTSKRGVPPPSGAGVK